MYLKTRILWLGLAALLGPATLATADTAGRTGPESPNAVLGAESAVREALAASPELRSVRQAIEVARGRLMQAGRPDNPRLSISASDDFAFAGDGERSQAVSLDQRYPIRGRLTRARGVARGDLRISEAEAADFARRLIAETLGAFHALLQLDRQLDIQADRAEAVHVVERVAERRLRRGEGSPSDVGLLRVERLRLEELHRRLEAERAGVAARLTRLLGRSPGGPLRISGDLDPGALASVDEAQLLASAEARRPDLTAAWLGVERALADVALARSEVWEDWTFGVSFDRDRQVFGNPIGIKRDSFLGVGVRVPLPVWDRRRGRIAAAQAQVRVARRAAQGLKLRLEEEVRNATARLEALKVGALAYRREVLPESDRTRRTVEHGYADGLVKILSLLEAQRQDGASRSEYAALLGDLRQAAIDLESAAASSPYLDGLLPGPAQR